MARPPYFPAYIPPYDWVNNNGYSEMGAWIEEAAKKAGR